MNDPSDPSGPPDMLNPTDITALLSNWQSGDSAAIDRLMSLVYADLRRLAHRELYRQHRQATLNPTALVHETYLRLATNKKTPWKNRGHFFAVAATAMRQIIVDYARKRRALKRGGGLADISLEDTEIAIDDQAEMLVAVDEALRKVSTISERLTKVVECRFFAGLTADETAEALGITRRTVHRDWLKAQALLRRELQYLGVGNIAPSSDSGDDSGGDNESEPSSETVP